MIGRRCWMLCSTDAGFNRHRVAVGIDVEDAVHARQRHQHLVAVAHRRAAGHQAGQAALRYDLQIVRVAEFDDGRDFFRSSPA